MDPDSAVRFWVVLGLANSQSDEAGVFLALQSALQEVSVSVRITAAEGLFNLGHYEEGLPVLIEPLNHPIPQAQIRAAGVLDSQPPEASEELQPAIERFNRPLEENTG